MEILMNGRETGPIGILLYAIVVSHSIIYPSKREREREGKRKSTYTFNKA